MDTLQRVFYDLSDLEGTQKTVSYLVCGVLAISLTKIVVQHFGISGLGVFSTLVAMVVVSIWITTSVIRCLQVIEIIYNFNHTSTEQSDATEIHPEKISLRQVVMHMFKLVRRDHPITVVSTALTDDGQTVSITAFVDGRYGTLEFDPQDLFVEYSSTYLQDLSTGKKMTLDTGFCLGCKSLEPARSGFAHTDEGYISGSGSSEVMLCKECIWELLNQFPDQKREEMRPYAIVNTV